MKWLMKAEPDSRVVKGKDVKFSVDDFEAMKVSPWEGVRSFEARNILRDKMKVGDEVLFYHSNCKNPGIAAFAKVIKEGYPDYTAWDQSHPYFDLKTDKENPKWYMVDVEFVQRAKHFIPLALLRHLATLNDVPEVLQSLPRAEAADSANGQQPDSEPLPAPDLKADTASPYLTSTDLAAAKRMVLLNKGRLSVQPVEDDAWEVMEKLAAYGGWETLLVKKRKKPANEDANEEQPKKTRKRKKDVDDEEATKKTKKKRTVRRKVDDDEDLSSELSDIDSLEDK